MRFAQEALSRAAAVAAIASVLLLAPASVRAEQIDNPQYLLWSKFGVGSFAKLKSESKMAGMTTESEITYTLTELTAEKAVLEIATSMTSNGQKFEGAPITQEFPAKIEKVETPVAASGAPESKSEEGEETLEIAGQKLDAKWNKSTIDAGGLTTVSTAWTSDKVPGGVVKTVVTMTGSVESETSTVLVDFASK